MRPLCIISGGRRVSLGLVLWVIIVPVQIVVVSRIRVVSRYLKVVPLTKHLEVRVADGLAGTVSSIIDYHINRVVGYV